MFGALYGDVIGSYYETHCTKDYNFEFNNQSTFTDDSVLTVAVCKAILNNPSDISIFRLKERALEYAGQYKQFYSYHPNAGFGVMFSKWAREREFSVINSYGNGAAMRAVPIGFAYDSIEQVMLQAKASCLLLIKIVKQFTRLKQLRFLFFWRRMVKVRKKSVAI